MEWVEEKVDGGVASINYTVYFDNDKKHYVSIGPSRFTENMYYLWHIVGGFTSIKETFEANSLEEAKEKAAERIKRSVNSTIAYYEVLLHQIKAKI